MSRDEQEKIKFQYYKEAIRYMDNAKATLVHANKQNGFYQDKKYVKTACGMAYNGVLVALDGYLILHGIDVEKKKSRKSIRYYQELIAGFDRKLLDFLNAAYDTLHLSGYYDGNRDAKIISRGFDLAYNIINKIKPAATAQAVI